MNKNIRDLLDKHESLIIKTKDGKTFVVNRVFAEYDEFVSINAPKEFKAEQTLIYKHHIESVESQ
ncbi:hypothetical protein HMPREF2563_06920 [Staphylococcus sp. HMSC057G10]|uniref:hypothetical protein n=1 Tax=Staphylococcus TaxID=1279 RepID=UPI0008A8426F|nr:MULTISPECIES: hypothetical protein [Staphylococcus]OHO94487.1 hypothetical protein HMPREF2563_06920 [Staphylococcus sp. HMSC057G10]